MMKVPRPLREVVEVEKAVDHAEAVALLVGQASTDQLTGFSVRRRLAILDDIGADGRLLDHVGEVAFVHLRHSAARVADREILLEQLVLLLGGPGLARRHLEVRVLPQQLALRGVAVNSAASTRTETQGEESMQLGR